MAEFIKAYNITMKHEGGYHSGVINGVKDRGGETYKGIARKFWGNWSGWTIIDSYAKENKELFEKNLEKHERLQDLVHEFYKKKFWDSMKLDEVPHQIIAEKLFDIGVNQGVPTASKYFQDILNMLNNNQKHYSNIVVDGKVGNATLDAYKRYFRTADKFRYRSEESNTLVFLNALRGEQYSRYEKIVKRDEEQEAFFYGWLKRI